jgi:hypothetical protein
MIKTVALGKRKLERNINMFVASKNLVIYDVSFHKYLTKRKEN